MSNEKREAFMAGARAFMHPSPLVREHQEAALEHAYESWVRMCAFDNEDGTVRLQKVATKGVKVSVVYEMEEGPNLSFGDSHFEGDEVEIFSQSELTRDRDSIIPTGKKTVTIKVTKR
jgi:hypothetical protein